MKRNTISLIIVILCTIFSLQGQDYTYLDVPNTIGPITIHKNNSDIIYSAVSSSLSRTDDGGMSVNPVKNNLSIFSITEILVSPINAELLFVKTGLYILRSSNGGKNFEILFNDGQFITVHPVNTLTYFIVRNKKEVWRSDDEGINWYFVYSFQEFVREINVSLTDTSIFYCIADYSIYRSDDSGYNWIKTHPFSYYEWSFTNLVINPFNPNSIYIRKENRMYHSTDSGKVLNEIHNLDVLSFTIDYNDTLTIYACMSGNTFVDKNIMKTTNGGLDWFLLTNGFPEDFAISTRIIMDPMNSNILYAPVLGIYKSTDGGENWFKVKLNTYGYLNFVDESQNGKIFTRSFISEDYGVSWIRLKHSFNSYLISLGNMKFNPMNSNNGLAIDIDSSYPVHLVNTTDNGFTWNYFTHIDLTSFVNIFYHPTIENLIFASAKYDPQWPELFLRSTDEGVNWDTIYYSQFQNTIFDIIFYTVEINTILARANFYIMKSTDLGVSWEQKMNGIVRELDFSCIVPDPHDPDRFYLGQQGRQEKGHLYVTNDAGESWQLIDSFLKELDPWVSVNAIYPDPVIPGRLYVGLNHNGNPFTGMPYSHGGLYLTENYGKTWRKVFDGGIRDIFADTDSPRTIYANTRYGIIRFKDTLIVSSVNSFGTEIPKSYSLEQNYPNPFNPSTNIHFSIPEEGFVSLKLFNILGQKIVTLVNEVKRAGKYEITFDASQLTSGIYFYSLNAGNYIQTKKLILLR